MVVVLVVLAVVAVVVVVVVVVVLAVLAVVVNLDGGAKIPSDHIWHGDAQMLVGPLYGTCKKPPLWRIEFQADSNIFGKSVDS